MLNPVILSAFARFDLRNPAIPGRFAGSLAYTLAFILSLAALLCLLLAPAPAAAGRYASIVIDADSGRVLHEAYADDRKYPASLAKMMTLYLLFEALEKKRFSIEGSLPVSARAEGMPPSKLGLKRGSKIKVRDLILALVTKSANDAAVVAAEAMAKTEIDFAKIMTAKAKQLGMKRTEFRNASGLPNRYQKSTARDMATLARALIRDFPQYYHFFSETSFSYNKRKYSNHNSLLKNYTGTDGIKTGYIRASGFNLVASTERGGRRLIAVVFGGKTSRSRDAHTADLLSRGFSRIAKAVITPPTPPRRNPFQVAARETAPASAPQVAESAPAAAATSLQAPAPVETASPAAAIEATSEPAPAVIEELLQEEATATAEQAPVTATAEATNLAARAAPSPEVESAEAVSAWGVQVGAFSQFEPAHSATETAKAHLPEILIETKRVIRQVNANGSQLYRAQLIGLTEPTAREVCRALKARQQSCIVVPPQRAENKPAAAG